MSFFDYMMDEDSATTSLKVLRDSMKTGTGGTNNIWYRYRTLLGTHQSCTIRFLPASEQNASGPFWLQKKIIHLKFADPDNVRKDVNISIPVMQMYVGGKASDDLILGQVTRLYDEAQTLDKNGESEKAKQVRSVASYHYIRGECIAQGFVISGPPEKDTPPENPIRLFELNKQIVKILNEKIETNNPELALDYWPCHGKKGYNFIITKGLTGDGKYASYITGTGFSSKTSMWSDEHQGAFIKHGLWNLHSFLPPRPSDEEYELLAQIVEQSIAGNRVWDSDWENGLKTVKVYRTANADDTSSDDTTGLQEQVKASLSRMSGNGKATSTTSDVMAALSRVNTSPQDDENTNDGESTDQVDAEAEEVSSERPVRNEVRSLVDKIRRNQARTATAT